MSASRRGTSTPELLLRTVQKLEELELAKQEASVALRDEFTRARLYGFDTATLKVVLRLRKLTPGQRKERRALEAIYMASLGMLEGDPLTDEARRRLDEQDKPPAPKAPEAPQPVPPEPPAKGRPAAAPPKAPQAQKPLELKDPEEARTEGRAAAAAGKRIYDNPYLAGDPCRAAWDEGWCAAKKSHGMETPAAYQRRTKPPEKPKDDADKKGAA